jgi:hypothetical protein
MSLRILKGLIQLVIILITFECVTPLFSSQEGHRAAALTFNSKKISLPLFNTAAFEKAEEECGEEHRSKFCQILIADFTRIATMLSIVHTPRGHVEVFEHLCEFQPALFKLHRAFLI